MTQHEQTLRRAVQWAHCYVKERGMTDLGDRDFDDLVDSFYTLVERSGDRERAE